MMLTAILCSLLTAEPITASQLHDALQVPPRGAAAEALAERIRAAFPAGTDLKSGVKPLVDGTLVASIPGARCLGTVHRPRCGSGTAAGSDDA